MPSPSEASIRALQISIPSAFQKENSDLETLEAMALAGIFLFTLVEGESLARALCHQISYLSKSGIATIDDIRADWQCGFLLLELIQVVKDSPSVRCSEFVGALGAFIRELDGTIIRQDTEPVKASGSDKVLPF